MERESNVHASKPEDTILVRGGGGSTFRIIYSIGFRACAIAVEIQNVLVESFSHISAVSHSQPYKCIYSVLMFIL